MAGRLTRPTSTCAKHFWSGTGVFDVCPACIRETSPEFKGLETAYDQPVPGAKPQATPVRDTVPDPTTMQVGGTHYTKMAIQPMEYAMANKLNALQFTVLKYISRYENKNGLEDLLKARHALDMLIERYKKEHNAIR